MTALVSSSHPDQLICGSSMVLSSTRTSPPSESAAANEHFGKVGRLGESDSVNISSMILDARRGDSMQLGELLQVYRNYLTVLAASQIDPRLRARVSPSDIVQETMLRAHQGFRDFRGGKGVVYEAERASLRRGGAGAVESATTGFDSAGGWTSLETLQGATPDRVARAAGSLSSSFRDDQTTESELGDSRSRKSIDREVADLVTRLHAPKSRELLEAPPYDPSESESPRLADAKGPEQGGMVLLATSDRTGRVAPRLADSVIAEMNGLFDIEVDFLGRQ